MVSTKIHSVTYSYSYSVIAIFHVTNRVFTHKNMTAFYNSGRGQVYHYIWASISSKCLKPPMCL